MKRTFFILIFLPFLVAGQTKFSQLPTVLPDASTSLVGLKYVSGTYTDYLFTLSQLATYINSGTGTVTSVGLSMPSVFSVTPSAITTNGTFSVTAAGGQPANAFYATPNGASGALGLRTIVAADLPLTGTPGTYGDVTHIPSVTTDAYGRVTGITTYTFSGSGGGTVTSVTAGSGLSGGTITSSGTISMPNVGTAGTYGDFLHIPVLTTDAEGRVTAVTSTYIGALVGAYSPLSVSSGAVSLTTVPTNLGGTNLTSYTTGDILYCPTTNVLARLPIGAGGQVLTVSAGLLPAWQSATGGGVGISTLTATSPLTGGTITGSSGTIGLATVGSSGTKGNSQQIPVFTTDAYGRVTSCTNTTVFISDPVYFVSDANYVASLFGVYSIFLELPGTITANRTLNLGSGATGEIVKVWNRNTSSFSWSFPSGTSVVNPDGSPIITLANNAFYLLESDGGIWVKMN